MKRLTTPFIYFLTTAASIFGLLPNLICLATNDPTRYQSLLLTSVGFAAFSVVGVVLYLVLSKGWWRVASAIPLAVSGYSVYAVFRMWPYAFP